MNRREFMTASAAVAAATALPLAAEELPSSIAALTSMRDQAKPITNDERKARVAKARELMAREKVSALILTPGTSLLYFTNIRWSGGERLFAYVIPVKGDPFVVCPAFEEDRAREQAGSIEIRTWQEDESPYMLLAKGLKGKVALEENAKYIWANRIAAAAPQAQIVSGIPITAGCRMIKDAHELELMQIASNATLKVYEAVYRAIQPGMTQNQVSDLVDAAYRRVGFRGGASVQTGEFTALPHGSAKPQVIREGTIIMIDDGCTVEGYQSDITRTFVIGKASDKAKSVFDIVAKAQAVALNYAKPGVPLESIDAAARSVITGAGFGPAFKHFTHRLGHGIGMDGHEWPYLVKHDMYGWPTELKAQAGMTFSNEPGIYLRGEFGVRLEDDMVITADGARLFTKPSRSLEQPFE